MFQGIFRQTARAALAFLVIVPNLVAAEPLRREAVSYRTKGYEAQQRGDLNEALSDYQKAAELDTSYPIPLNDAGVVLEGLGRLEDAEQAYLKALSINPNYLEPHANLGILYERMKQKDKAIYYWTKRYQLGDPSDAWTARAGERLVALGAMPPSEKQRMNIATRRHVADQELQNHAQSVKDYRAVTDSYGNWP